MTRALLGIRSNTLQINHTLERWFHAGAISHTFLLVVVTWAAPVFVSAAMFVLLRHTVERIWPMEFRRGDPGAINLLSCVVWNIATHIFAPVVAVMTVLLINRLGGGWIVLPGHGLGLVLGFAAYAVFQDLGEYLFHRAEHAVPGLWAMHSLHHSDRHFDASTGIPHHWGCRWSSRSPPPCRCGTCCLARCGGLTLHRLPPVGLGEGSEARGLADLMFWTRRVG